MDYKETLNLPQTDFPMRAKLPQREPELLKWWDEIKIYDRVCRHRAGAPKFILHDGPPYANGDIHMGTALNKVLKDMIIKYKTMRGYDSPYVPGWDTHGLPIEHQIIKTKGINRKEIPEIEFRRMCREYALHYVDLQREQFKRLGVRGDWENPTDPDPSFEAKQIEIFGQMAAKGYIYKGLKPVYWCASCETALAEAEIEYSNRSSDSLYVRFAVKDDRGLLGGAKKSYCLIWTTTAWTIPANLAICLHPDFDYVLVDAGSAQYLLAEALLEPVSRALGDGSTWTVLKRFKGRELEGVVCTHPLVDRESPLILGEHVTLEQGTGCVHTAPGHGLEDFTVGRAYKLPVLSPLDDSGVFTEEAGEFAGMHYSSGGKAVIEALRRSGALLKASTIEHQYPNCWRCKEPVLFRATEQWFASVEGFCRRRWRRCGRCTDAAGARADLTISAAGLVHLPAADLGCRSIFYCQGCHEPVINEQTIEAVRGLCREGSMPGSAGSAGDPARRLLLPGCGGGFSQNRYHGCWFDSGSSHAAVLETRPSCAGRRSLPGRQRPVSRLVPFFLPRYYPW